MTTVTVKIEGLRELDAALGELPKATAKNVLRRTIISASKPLVSAAQQMAPDRGGKPPNDLSNSITISSKLNKNQKRETRGNEKDFVEMYVGPDVSVPNPHGVFQEFGTVHHGPQPFMRPAWDGNKMAVLEKIKDELGSQIMKSAARLARKRGG